MLDQCSVSKALTDLAASNPILFGIIVLIVIILAALFASFRVPFIGMQWPGIIPMIRRFRKEDAALDDSIARLKADNAMLSDSCRDLRERLDEAERKIPPAVPQEHARYRTEHCAVTVRRGTLSGRGKTTQCIHVGLHGFFDRELDSEAAEVIRGALNDAPLVEIDFNGARSYNTFLINSVFFESAVSERRDGLRLIIRVPNNEAAREAFQAARSVAEQRNLPAEFLDL